MPEKEVYVRGKIPESLKVEFKAACVLDKRPMDEVMAELIEDWLIKRKSTNKDLGETKSAPN